MSVSYVHNLYAGENKVGSYETDLEALEAMYSYINGDDKSWIILNHSDCVDNIYGYITHQCFNKHLRQCHGINVGFCIMKIEI